MFSAWSSTQKLEHLTRLFHFSHNSSLIVIRTRCSKAQLDLNLLVRNFRSSIGKIILKLGPKECCFLLNWTYWKLLSRTQYLKKRFSWNYSSFQLGSITWHTTKLDQSSIFKSTALLELAQNEFQIPELARLLDYYKSPHKISNFDWILLSGHGREHRKGWSLV